MNSSKPKVILAVASSGGHWIQLRRMRSAFEGNGVTYLTTSAGHKSEIEDDRVLVVNDASRWNKFGLVLLALRVSWILIRLRPDIVISTGAAPGLFALAFGKLCGARTIWIDSIANAGELSMSGKLAGKFADLWLTQWPHLEAKDGPVYRGSVL